MNAPVSVLVQPTCPGDVILTSSHGSYSTRATNDPETAAICFEVCNR